MNATYDGPRLALDFDALAHNWRTVCAAGMGQPVGAVVKNDAYGLGVAAVVLRPWALGCREFWVATLHEALAVRHSLRDAAAGAARILALNGLAGARPGGLRCAGADAGAHRPPTNWRRWRTTPRAPAPACQWPCTWTRA